MPSRPIPKAPTAWTKDKVESQNVADEDGDNDKGDQDCKGGQLKKFYSYYPESTAFHGLPKIYGARSRLLQLLWAALFLTAFGVMVSQLIQLFTTYYSWPVKTTVTLGYSSLTFPAVSLCNLNPFKLSLVKKAPCELQYALPVEDVFRSQECVMEAAQTAARSTSGPGSGSGTDDYDYVVEECYFNDAGEEVCETVSSELLDDEMLQRREISKIIMNTNRDLRYEIGHKIEDMLLDCSINGRKCFPDNFTHFLSNDFGNCYTFQTNGLVTRESGLDSGLHMTLNLELEDFVDFYKSGYGLRLIVHERGVRPFPSAEGLSVSAGTEVSVGLRQVKLERMGGKYGKCATDDEFMELFRIKYTVEACRSLCLRMLVSDICDCRYMDDFDIVMTDVTKESCIENEKRRCEEQVEKNFTKSREEQFEMCSCASPCKETSFQHSISSRLWPSLTYVSALEKQVCDRDPNSTKCKTYAETEDEYQKRSLSFARIIIYFQTLNYEHIKEEAFYNMERFLSDIGGTMGLWIGASLLSLAELMELVLETSAFIVRRMCQWT